MKNVKLAPICLFTYNRLEETKATIEALQKNYLAKQSDLYIFSDGPKNENAKDGVHKVRKYLKGVTGFNLVEIKESTRNKGLANSIIDGVSEVIDLFGSVIVVEDDLKTTPNFLDFMNRVLDYYSSNLKIQSISGYSLEVDFEAIESDVFFHRRTHSWSWATWENRWSPEIFDKKMIKEDLSLKSLSEFKRYCGNDISEMLLNSLNGKNDSWYVRWAYNHFKNETYCVYPFKSKIDNIGFSELGTNCLGIDVFKSDIDNKYLRNFKFVPIYEQSIIDSSFRRYFSKGYKIIFRLKLLRNSNGRKKVLTELKTKIFKR